MTSYLYKPTLLSAALSTFLFTLSLAMTVKAIAAQEPGAKSPKIVVDGKEVPGTVNVITDPSTGTETFDIKTAGSHNRPSGAKKPPQGRTQAPVQTPTPAQSPAGGEAGPAAAATSIFGTDGSGQGAASPTTEIQGSDGRVYYTTTLTFGTLTVKVPKGKISSDRVTIVEASLVLNPVVPQRLREVGKQLQGKWYITADYQPLSDSTYFRAVAESSSEQLIPEVNNTLDWRWKIYTKSGFKRDESKIKLNVVYKAPPDKAEPPIKILSETIVLDEDDSVWWWEGAKAFFKDYMQTIVTSLALLIPSAFGYRKLRAETKKAEAEAETARLELAKAGESSAFYENFWHQEYARMRGDIQKLETERVGLKGELERLAGSNKRLNTENMGLLTKNYRLRGRQRRDRR